MTAKPIKVKELIQALEKFNPDLPVVYQCWSENVLLEADDLEVKSLCVARPDGWVANPRDDKPTIEYLVFPGN